MSLQKKHNLFLFVGLFSLFFILIFSYVFYLKQDRPNPEIVNKFQTFTGEVIISNIVEFQSDMNKKSVEENTKIFPNVKANFVWVDNKTMKIELSEKIEKDTEFVINVMDSALDLNGNKLEKSIVQNFKVDGISQIDFVTPEGEITDLTKNITVRFSKPIVSLTTFDNQPDCPIKITPEIPGKCVWITTSTFQFRPEEGFPIGAKYSINIPSGIKTIAGDKTINSKDFQIFTPKFEILDTTINGYKDKPLLITFNAPISLENFKENFEIDGFELTDLNIDYFTVDSNIKGEKEIKKNIVSIFPKNTDWGYGKSYNYTLKEGLKSVRGNVNIGKNTINTFFIQKLITGYSPFVYKKEDIENKELISNLRKSNSSNIITKNNPKILLNFYEEVSLDNNLFSITNQSGKYLNFNLKYAKKINTIGEITEIVDDKKNIILEIFDNNINSLNINVLTSKISNSNDDKLYFNTKNLNEVLDYKFINYKKSCLVLKNDIGYDDYNYKNFDFGDEDSKVNYINFQGKYSQDEDCKYEEGKYTYILRTSLNPNSDYNLKIKKELLDEDNYPLLREFNTSFKTNLALNEDKRVWNIDDRDLILVPTEISPLGISIQTKNLDKVEVTVCEGLFDILQDDYMNHKVCETKEVPINNLGFKTNFSVLNLEEIFGRKFTKSIISFNVEKLKNDKTKYEIKYDGDSRYNNQVRYLRTDKSLVLKSNNSNILWLSDFKTGELLSDQIQKVERYEKKSKYSMLGRYIGKESVFKNFISSESLGNGMYKLSGDLVGYLLVTLKSGEQILFDATNAHYSTPSQKVYLTTDRPIYKPGNKVKIKGTVRKETATEYQIQTGEYDLVVRDSKYNEIVNEKISLSKNGTFTFEFDLDKESSLGNYNINYLNSSLSFTVEEFEKPDFKVESKSEKEFYLYGETPIIGINADYYIGSPLSNGKGYYSIIASNYNFDGGKTQGYIWGENNNFWRYLEDIPENDNRNIEYHKEFTLDNLGKADLEIDSSKTSKDMVYNISSTIEDPNTKKTISSNSSFKLLNSPVFVGLKLDKYYYDFADNAKLDFVSVDTEGNKVGNQKLNLRIYKINYSFDELTYQTQKEEKLLTEKSITTDKDGFANTNYKINDYGEFRFEIELNNKKYKTTKTIYVSGLNLIKPTNQEHDLSILKDKEKYNIGDNAEFIIQSPITGVKALVTAEKLDEVLYKEVIDIQTSSQKFILPIKKEYLPNFELKVFIIKSTSYSKKTLEQLKKLRIEMIELEEKLFQSKKTPIYVPYDIVYRKGFIPPYINEENLDKDLLLKLAGLKASEQKIMQDLIPNYYFGEQLVKISLDSIKLKSEAKTDKQNYLPSDSSIIELNITDNNGNPISGEAVISVVDEALLALKNNDKDIVDFFYSDKPNKTKTIFNLQNLIKRFEFVEEEITINYSNDNLEYDKDLGFEEEMSFSDSIGSIKNMNIVQKSKSELAGSPSRGGSSNNATKLRVDFKDSAYYKGVVEVVNGKTTVNIPKLPDNLTTWVVKGYTVTNDTKVGNFETKFKVKKNLNLLPSIPRFFVSGDELELSAIIVNNSSKTLKVKSEINITNAEVIKKPGKKTIAPNGQELITWKIKVDQMKNDIDWNKYNSEITLKVVSDNYEDSLKQTRKIIPYSTPEYTFTNGSTYYLSYEEKINLPKSVDQNQGQLDITMGASILTSLLDSIDNIASMPMDNFYSTVSALKKGAILKGLYKEAGRIKEFNKITVVDYNGISHNLNEILKQRITDIKDYQNFDGGMMYYDDCIPLSWMKTCSSFGLTGEFLSAAQELKENGYLVDEGIVNKALNYYKKELEKDIKNYEKNPNNIYRNIDPFYKIVGYDKDFIKKYLLSDRFTNTNYEFNNIDKLKIILLLQYISPNSNLIDSYISELKNKTIIEARGSLIPSDDKGKNNLISTALALRVFINEGENEKLIIENFTRWLMAQKRENGNFGNTYDTSEVIKTITDYIIYTGELENVNFTSKGYLNYKEVVSSKFDDNNKFSLQTNSFNLKDNIEFGKDNSLGFEKKGNGKLYYDVGLRYFLPIEEIVPRDEGIIVTRNYYDYLEYNNAFTEECINPIWFGKYYDSYKSYNYCKKIKIKNIESVSSGNKGDLLVGEIEIIVPSERNNVIVNNFIPAGAEIVNTNLDTTSSEIKNITGEENSNYRGGFSHIETKNDRLTLFASSLYKGTYKYIYVIKLNHKGNYHHRPAVAEEIKKPEIWGRSKGEWFEIK